MTRFVILDFARFVFALLIAIKHFDGFAAPPKAYLAVDFFFILSGFVLSVAYVDKFKSKDFYMNFITDRISRIYPLHILTLFALIPIHILYYITSGGKILESGWSYQDGIFYTFVLNVLLIQNVGVNSSVSWNAPSWSISVEMFVNLFLGLILIAVVHKRIVWPFLIAVPIACYAIIFSQFGSLAVTYERAFGFINSGLLRGIAGIFLGVVSFQCWRWLETRPKIITAAIYVSITTIMVSLLIMIVPIKIPNGDFAIVPIMFCFITSVAIVEARRPIRFGYIRSILIYLGALSYSVYLIHWVVLTFIRYQIAYVWEVNLNFDSPISLLAFIAITLALSALIHQSFEIPMKNKLKAWFA
ncbi:acyltransferase family protein [Affinirhizobium pseudoryzae]|uniref:acyltransferase family protein n=1 Tax=Allorhizobium pseudoryzae TaxID=379684 RepID=UPI0013EA9833|nr:acyltransferase [Allorhizobium pseudoryzae]